jgi:hypothetical protein
VQGFKPVSGALMNTTIFGKEQWKQHYGDPGDVPPLPKELINSLNGPCPIYKGKNFSDTHIVVYIPATINEMPLTVNRMEELAKSPKSSINPTHFDYIWPRLRNEFGKQPIRGGYWLAMIKEPIPETLGKTYEEQIAYLKRHCAGYELPETIDVIICIFMNYVCSGMNQERLFGRMPWRLTRCAEMVGDLQAVVGGFAPDGVDVCYFFYDSSYEFVGIAPVRKFFNSENGNSIIVSVDDRNVEFNCFGEGSPLLLIGEFGKDHSVWQPMLPKLTMKHKVIIYYPPSHEQSTSIALLLSKALKLLNINSSIHVIGYSTGCAIALVLAKNYPAQFKSLKLIKNVDEISDSIKDII